MDEAELIAGSQRGDQRCFRLLMDRYRTDLSRLAYLMTRDNETAKDVLQETLVQVWKSLPSYRPKGSFKAWMLKVLVNKARRHYRRKRIPVEPIEAAYSVESEAESPHDAAQREEDRQRIREALSELSDDHREALVLRYFSEMSVPEIAQALGCREGTVKSRLSRAHDRMRQALIERSVGPTDLRLEA